MNQVAFLNLKRVVKDWDDGMVVDTLGKYKAEMAALEKHEKLLKAELIRRGKSEYDGDMFRATVTRAIKFCLNMKAVRAKLSRQFINANSTEQEVTSVRVVARIAHPRKRVA